MSDGDAPGEIIIAMGSPGTTRNSTNTTRATPTRVNAAMPRRCSKPEIMASLEGESADLRPPCALPCVHQALLTSVGWSAPVWLATTLSEDL